MVQLGKIVEIAVYRQIYSYFEESNLFHPNQYGAIKNHSTATAIIHVHEKWLESTDKNNLSASCLIDQTAAFDILCHRTLAKKLKLYNFHEKSINWILSYLGDRSQAVQIESSVSKRIKGGSFSIPQGSVLGSLIHVINCNDLPACHKEEKTDGVVYIDDDTDTVSAPDSDTLVQKIQKEAINSAEWIGDNFYCISGEKSKLMVIANKSLKKARIRDKLSIIIDGKTIEESNSERLLGVITSNDLTWKAHLYGDGENKGLLKHLAQRLGIVKKLSKKMSKVRLRTFAEGIFYSKLKNCLQVFGNVFGIEKYKEQGSRYTSYTKSANHDLQVLQNKLNRVLLGDWRNLSTEELCARTNSLSVQQTIARSTIDNNNI